MHPKLEEMLYIGSWSRHNGKYKSLTENCSSCDWYIVLENEKRCYWGVAMKHLIKGDKLRKCEYFGKPSPREEIYSSLKQKIHRTYLASPEPQSL